MTAHLDATQPALLLRLLLGDERADPGELEWNAVPALAGAGTAREVSA